MVIEIDSSNNIHRSQLQLHQPLTCYLLRSFFLDWYSLTMLPLPNFVVRGQFYSGEFQASQRYLSCLECLSLIQGIFLASSGSSRVHSLVIHLQDLEADLVTADRTDSVIYSPRPYPTTPSSFKSGNLQQSYIKQQSHPAFRMPASPP